MATTLEILCTRREDLVSRLTAFQLKEDAGVPLTREENDDFDTLIMQYGEVENEIDAVWSAFEILSKKPIWKRIFTKN